MQREKMQNKSERRNLFLKRGVLKIKQVFDRHFQGFRNVKKFIEGKGSFAAGGLDIADVGTADVYGFCQFHLSQSANPAVVCDGQAQKAHII